jgi:hypothetical protein
MASGVAPGGRAGGNEPAGQHRQRELHALPGDWPVPRPRGWLARVNLPADEQEETMIRDAIKRNRPVGRAAWVEQTAVAGGPGAVPATPRPDGANARVRVGKASNGSRDLYFVLGQLVHVESVDVGICRRSSGGTRYAH